METTTEKELQEPTPTQQRVPRVWLWPLAIGGICLVLSCITGSGWFFWQNYTQQAEEQDTTLASPSQQDHEVDMVVLAATPTSIPTSSAATPEIQTEQGSAISTCANETPIDSPAATTPTLGAISFATHHDQNGWPVDNALQFTSTVTTVLASFNYDGMRDGLKWERVWYFGDQEMSRGSGTWDAGSRGQLTIQVANKEGGFIPGLYKLELYVEGQLLGQSSFSVMAADTPTQRPVQVAYTTWDGQKHQLNRLDLDTRQTELLNEFGRWPTWSSDAVGLIFYGESGSTAGPPGLWVLNMAQRKSYQLSQETFFQSLAWSPNRTYIASAAMDEPGSHLVLWHLDQNQAYTGPPGEEPAWSPEGRRLAYRGCSEAGWHISTIQVIGHIFDTTSIRHLTTGNDSQPAWSSNGQRIAFVRREGDNQDIYTVSPDGSNLIRLTDHPAADTAPAWTPDHRLLFRSLRDGQWGIYIMNADGSDQRQLITTPAQPDWQPDPLAVASNAPPVTTTTTTPAAQPQAQIPPGRGLLVVSNQQNNDEMTFTIDNREHKVRPFQVKTIPLNPGHYTWTASWPGKNSRTGIADIVLGQIAYPVVER